MIKILTKFRRWRAARNLLRLYSGELSEQQARENNPWNDPESEYYDEFCSMSFLLANMENLSSDKDLKAWSKGEEDGIGTKQYLVRRWRGLAIASGLVLTVAFGLQIYFGNPIEKNNSVAESQVLRYSTGFGEQKKVKLSDGSIVTLNVATQLLVDISDTERRVILEKGEALFDITKDALRPFTVTVGLRSVSVLGTVFNILKSPDEFILSVVEGEVIVRRAESKIDQAAPLLEKVDGKVSGIGTSRQYRVSSGWVAEFDEIDKEMTAYKTDKIEQKIEWRNGQISVEGEDLFKVMQQLNRYSKKKILIEDPSIMTLKIYAVLRVDQLNTTLHSLERMLPIRITDHSDRIVITGLNKTDT